MPACTHHLNEVSLVDRTWYALSVMLVQVTEKHRISVRRTALLATRVGVTHSPAPPTSGHTRAVLPHHAIRTHTCCPGTAHHVYLALG